MNFTILRFESIGSTNDEALRQAKAGAAEGLCVIAKQQNAGRGRHGRTWISSKDAGLYFSVVFRPKLEPKFISLMTLMAGVGVHETLREFGLQPDIKWVNDILIGEKKIAGILAEATETPLGLAVVIGIGINFKSTNFPDEMAEFATSIDGEGIISVTLSELEHTLVRFLGFFYEVLSEENGPAKIIDEWRQRSTYFSGKSVQVAVPNSTFTGVTDGLEPTGSLRVLMPDGKINIVHTGDVRKLRAAT